MKMNSYIKRFSEIRIADTAVVGGKNASLGEMYTQLTVQGIHVPDGFATTCFAFEEFLTHNALHLPLHNLMAQLDTASFANLAETGRQARTLMMKGQLPPKIKEEVISAYQQLTGNTGLAVAVRSSATAEDLPNASFAGQHESYLNIKGESQLLYTIQKCFASLYTDRAIKYRHDNGFAHEKVSLSVGVQKMVRSDLGSSGIIFTLEPESGFRNIIHLSGVWGLGENIVQGTVTPDEFLVFKPTLHLQKGAIIQRKLGEKTKTMVYSDSQESTVINTVTPAEKRRQFVLHDAEVIKLAEWSMIIENHYQKPMDIEWAKDGATNELFIIQARPETVHSQKNPLVLTEYHITTRGDTLAQGEAIGSKLAVGIARVLDSPREPYELKPGEILVTELTSPDWDPVLKNAAAIITGKGGRTSHASIVARELGVPAIVGCGDFGGKITDGDFITVSCCEGKTGFVYQGRASFTETAIDLSKIKKTTTKAMLIVADPEQSFKLSFYPNDGVGLMRMEFIITHAIRIHPMALVHFSKLQDSSTKDKIEALTLSYPDKKQYFVDKLSEGIGTIAAAFYPKDVIVRLSDFKTNEYAGLIGGKDFEPKEENPMIGFRGASRYYHDLYREGFSLECEAIKKVRNEMGLTNVKVMVPFCRTVEEGKQVLLQMQSYELQRGVNNLQVYVMAEIPSNVILAEKFAEIFDGFSIGSNDLTQLTLGVDRDSAILASLFSEQDAAVKEMIASVIRKAKAAGVPTGLCGQAPSDFPEFTKFLVERGIDSISFNADALLKGIENIQKAEHEAARNRKHFALR